MEAIVNTIFETPEVNNLKEVEKPVIIDCKISEAFAELERGVHAALETYSNVHRGSGHNSIVTTHLFEQARDIVLDYLNLRKSQFTVIFCSARSAEIIKTQVGCGSCHCLSSRDLGLSLGIYALAVKKESLPRGAPFHSGGGTARLISKDWVVWAKTPDKFEAGTPAIINIIAFATALRMVQQQGKDIFRNFTPEKLTAAEILHHDSWMEFTGKELLHELRKTLIGRGVQVPTSQGIVPFINFDNSASTQTFVPVFNTFRNTLSQPEETKKAVIQEVKSTTSGFLNAPLSDYEIIFTSNTTEAINLAAESFKLGFAEDSEPVVVNTLLEHSSNELPWRMIPGCSTIRLSVNAEGFIDLNELESTLSAHNKECRYGKKRIRLVAVSGASNVLGISQNIIKISQLVHRYGAHLLIDAAQLVAHRKIDMERCGIDYLAFSAHKLYAPFGTGVLVVRKNLLQFNTEELELIQTSGEENAGGIAALGKALVLLQRIGMDLILEEEQVLTERALRCMSQIDGLEIYGVKRPESPEFKQKLGVIAFVLKNKMATQVGKELALFGGIGVRTGCHCAHIIIKHLLKVGPGLEKFQKMIVTIFPKLSLPGVVRISFGIQNSEEEVDRFIQALGEIAGQPRATAKQKINSLEMSAPVLTKKEVKEQINNFVKYRSVKVYAKEIK